MIVENDMIRSHIHTLGNSIVFQQQIPQFLQDTVASVVAFVPVIISTLVVLIIGWIIGRVLGGVVTRILERIGLSDYAQDTPLETEGDGIASTLGTLAAYLVYFYTILAVADILNIDILSQLLSTIGQFLPVVLSAIVVLVIGFVIGRVVGDIITDVIGEFGLEGYFRDTPLENITARIGGVGGIVGLLVEYYIYFLTLLATADILQIPIFSDLLNTFAGYVPILIGGLIILFIGILVGEFLEDIVASTDASRLTTLLGLGAKLFVYYIAITIALDTIGFSTAVLTTFFTATVTAFFGALGLGLAIAIGIGVGWGSKDYVAENIDDWISRARGSASEIREDGENTSNREFESSGDSSMGGSGE